MPPKQSIQMKCAKSPSVGWSSLYVSFEQCDLHPISYPYLRLRCNSFILAIIFVMRFDSRQRFSPESFAIWMSDRRLLYLLKLSVAVTLVLHCSLCFAFSLSSFTLSPSLALILFVLFWMFCLVLLCTVC